MTTDVRSGLFACVYSVREMGTDEEFWIPAVGTCVTGQDGWVGEYL